MNTQLITRKLFCLLIPLAALVMTHPSVAQSAEDSGAGESSNLRARQNKVMDRVSVMSSFNLQEGETVKDAVAVGSNAEIDGTVEGDLVLVFSKARLGPNTDVRGDLIVVGTEVDADPGIRIKGERIVIGGLGSDLMGIPWLRIPQQWVATGLLFGRPLPPHYWWAWGVAAFSILLYLLTAFLFPRPVLATVESLAAQPGASFFYGLLALVLLFPVLILLAITGIGLFLVPFLMIGAVVVYFFGKAAVYSYVGQRLGQQFNIGFLQQPLLALVAGGVLLTLLYMVPVVGLLMWMIVLSLGIGAVIHALAINFIKRPAAGNGTAQLTAPPVLPPASSGEVDGSALLQMPRAGFWIRTLATLLDLVLVFVVCALIHHRDWFPICWIVYHVGFWGWKGTTLGGILVGLKILRTNGESLDFPVALVRSLASCFSFVVLGIGFFWVGWSEEKQSWHDKIAGTVIVRLPKGTPLI